MTEMTDTVGMTDYLELMAEAYLEAVALTDFGDIDQPPADSTFSDLAKCQAYLVCRNFYWANRDLIGSKYKEAAHDLWLTRNGHGTGFWDRPEVWGEDGAEILARCAQTLGCAEAYQGDDGLIYFDR